VRVKYLLRAAADLESATDYIARDSPEAARRVAVKITKAIQALRRHPAKGRPGRVPGTRELVIAGTPYIVPYRVRGNSVEILRIFHAARKWSDKP